MKKIEKYRMYVNFRVFVDEEIFSDKYNKTIPNIMLLNYKIFDYIKFEDNTYCYIDNENVKKCLKTIKNYIVEKTIDSEYETYNCCCSGCDSEFGCNDTIDKPDNLTKNIYNMFEDLHLSKIFNEIVDQTEKDKIYDIGLEFTISNNSSHKPNYNVRDINLYKDCENDADKYYSNTITELYDLSY